MSIRALSRWEWAGLIAAVVLASWLRLPDLDRSPPGFFCDEASVGYDAVALMETGADQYGRPFPLFARSFGDYDEASYRYLTIPAIALLGPTITATRLPAAIAGIALVVALFFLARRWFGPRAAIATGLLAAASPWTVLFSRIAFRGILLPAALVIAVVLVERARVRGRGLVWAGVAFAAALWTYSPARLIVPAFVVVLLLAHGRELWRTQRNELLGAAAVFAAMLLALGTFWISPEGMARANSELRSSWGGFALDYVGYLRPAFLFDEGDPNLRHSFRGWGQLLPLEMLTLAWGVFVALRRRRREDLFVIGWILVAIVPAALTIPHHALRAIAAAPAFTLLSGLGIGALIDEARTAAARRALATAAVVAYLAVGAHPLSLEVRRDYPGYASGAWQWGMREGIAALRATDRDCYVLTNRLFLPHIFVLFFGRVPPRDYQAHPIASITQTDMSYDRFEIGPWHVLPLPAGAASHSQCAFLSLTEEAPRMRGLPGYRRIEELHGPGGEHYFDVFVIDAPSP